jgi:drug/metabolite transporter (DMT)-like permease
MAVALGRTGFCFLTLLAAAATLRGPTHAGLRTAARRPRTVALLGFLGFFGYAAGTLAAIPLIGTSRTNLMVTLLPCLAFVLGVLFFHERGGRTKAAGTLLAAGAAAGYALLNGGSTAAGVGAAGTAAGLGLAFAATLGFAVYGFVYRTRMADVPPLAALPAILGAATAMLLPVALFFGDLGSVTWRQWLGIAVLGVVVYAPAYLVQHRLILLRGPLFTAAVGLVVPFLVRLGDWALGLDGNGGSPPGPAELALLAVCCAGIWLVVSHRAPPQPNRPAPGPDQQSD